ncbi:MAG: hypothetical protein KAU95_02575 [Candidatus Aenigmarchaeota archaeon]|nr:hypothetical protein [Candidatus Aenigmarchaeota archaeon]
MADGEKRKMSLNFSKVLNNLSKHKLAISLLILLGIFYLSFSVRLATVEQPHLLAADPHYWYRFTEYIAEDNIPEYDPLRLHPDYVTPDITFFPLTAAYSYKLAHFFTGIEFYRFLFWFPAFIAALSVFPAFWIGKELYSNKAGLFAAFFIGLTPSFLSRSMAGFFDTDCMIILLSVLTVALFLSAYNRIDINNFKKKSPIILSILTGISLAALSLTWSGGFAYIPWLFIGLFFLHYLYRLVIAKGNNFKEKLKHSWLFFRNYLLVYIVLFGIFICFTYPLQGFGPLNSIVGVTTFFQTAKAEGGIFPNVWVSISEEMEASLTDIIVRIGAPIFFFGFFGISTLLILFLRNLFSYNKFEGSLLTGLAGFLILFISVPSMLSANLFPILIFSFSLSGMLLGLVIKNKKFYTETFLFMFIWIAPTLYGSFWAVRFTQMLAIPMAICAGIAFGVLFDSGIKMIKKYK